MNTPKTEIEIKAIRASISEHAALIISSACTFFILAWVFWLLRFGVDFADEGFYLVWISNPFKYSLSISQFGFIYHPLYLLLDGNIAYLRQANVIITFVLSWVLTNIFIKTIYNEQLLVPVHRYIISASFSTASLIFLRLWLPTPSYNWLAFQSLLLCAIGFLFAEKTYTRGSVIGWVLIGVSGWLAFMAKPTTAAALGVCSGFYLISASKFNFRLLATSLATAFVLLVLSALMIDGSVTTFIDRLKDGLMFAELLGAGHKFTSILRLDNFEFGLRANLILIIGTACVLTVVYLSQTKIRALTYIGWLLQLGFPAATLSIVFGLTSKTIDAGEYQHLLLWIVPFAAILAGFSLNKFKGILRITRSQWALALTFLILPYAFSFGTANNYWWLGGLAGIFWLLAGFVFLAPIKATRKFIDLLMPFGFAVQFLTVAMVLTSIEWPYYQTQPLRKNDYQIDFGKPGSTLMVSNGFGLYIADATDLANKAGFKRGTPMLDLSGHSPGVLYALGASNTGQPWIIGAYPGYSGSNSVAAGMLQRVSCEELSSAWLLTEPRGPVKISADVLAVFGANLTTDFEIAATFNTAKGVGGFQEIQIQQVLKPIRPHDIAMNACAKAKQAKQ